MSDEPIPAPMTTHARGGAICAYTIAVSPGKFTLDGAGAEHFEL